MSAIYSVFYLLGGSSNFVCKSVVGKFEFETAEMHVAELNKMGYKAMSVKNGHVIGGYCSFDEFETPTLAAEYYNSL